MPLKSKGKSIGTLCVARHVPRRFHNYEMELLRSIGNQIGAALENARLYQDMKRALKQLQQSEERYRDLFENASDAIWLHDLEGKTLAANAECEKLTGYSSEELHGVPVDQLLEECSMSCVREIEERLLCNEPVGCRCEVELIKKGGDKALVQITTSLMTHDGEAVGFEHVARDVTDQRRMEENLRYYLQQATRAQEEERKRIARELHDETLQNLIVISRQMEKITSSEALWEESLEVVRGLKKQIEVAVQEMRRFSHNLRPSILDDLDLLPALELLVEDIEKEGIHTSFKIIGKVRRLSPEVEVMLFRIAQEAVRNISRHSQASTAELIIEFNDNRLKMHIKDNGVGFELLQSIGDQAVLGKLGLVGMRERARLLGGTMILDSNPGEGTTVTVEVLI
ncbi:PAS domain S-box protein [Chloroflexota bacterium]